MCGVLGCPAAGYLGLGPLSSLGVTEHQPQAYGLLGEGGDPRVIVIKFRWTKDGSCSGQFAVRATETPTEVRVSNVTSLDHYYLACAGTGTVNNMASAELHLTGPLGDRAVVRDSDGTRLPLSVF